MSPMPDTPLTILDRIEHLANLRSKGHTYIEGDGTSTYRSYAELIEEARRIQSEIARLGLKRGDRLALIAVDAKSFVAAFLGGTLAGVVLVPMSPPPVSKREAAYAEQLRRIADVAGVRAVVVTAAMEAVARSTFETLPLITYEALQGGTAGSQPAPEPWHDQDICFLQFTSGSTADPKGVVVNHRNIAANARAIMVDGIGVTASDVGVSWLPLFHDMGLIGKVLAPLIYATDMVYLPTFSFIKNPNKWLETISRHRGTVTFAPNFAFALAVRHFKRRPVPLDLSTLRVVGCGAEPVNHEVLTEFVETFARHGLPAEAVTPCYGLAEATLAVTFDSRKTAPRKVVIDRKLYEIERRALPIAGDSGGAEGVCLVSCGRVLPNHELAIVDSNGISLPEGRVGQIIVRGPSITRGYFENPAATAANYSRDWLMTGDLGFLMDGELFVSGRIKDLIIVNGHNYDPHDLEWLVEGLPGLKQRSVAAFSVNRRETEAVVIVVEIRESDIRADLPQEISNHLLGKAGLAVADIVLVPPGRIPRSTSGKIQRLKLRSQYLQELQ